MHPPRASSAGAMASATPNPFAWLRGHLGFDAAARTSRAPRHAGSRSRRRAFASLSIAGAAVAGDAALVAERPVDVGGARSDAGAADARSYFLQPAAQYPEDRGGASRRATREKSAASLGGRHTLVPSVSHADGGGGRGAAGRLGCLRRRPQRGRRSDAKFSHLRLGKRVRLLGSREARRGKNTTRFFRSESLIRTCDMPTYRGTSGTPGSRQSSLYRPLCRRRRPRQLSSRHLSPRASTSGRAALARYSRASRCPPFSPRDAVAPAAHSFDTNAARAGSPPAHAGSSSAAHLSAISESRDASRARHFLPRSSVASAAAASSSSSSQPSSSDQFSLKFSFQFESPAVARAFPRAARGSTSFPSSASRGAAVHHDPDDEQRAPAERDRNGTLEFRIRRFRDCRPSPRAARRRRSRRFPASRPPSTRLPASSASSPCCLPSARATSLSASSAYSRSSHRGRRGMESREREDPPPLVPARDPATPPARLRGVLFGGLFGRGAGASSSFQRHRGLVSSSFCSRFFSCVFSTAGSTSPASNSTRHHRPRRRGGVPFFRLGAAADSRRRRGRVGGWGILRCVPRGGAGAETSAVVFTWTPQEPPPAFPRPRTTLGGSRRVGDVVVALDLSAGRRRMAATSATAAEGLVFAVTRRTGSASTTTSAFDSDSSDSSTDAPSPAVAFASFASGRGVLRFLRSETRGGPRGLSSFRQVRLPFPFPFPSRRPRTPALPRTRTRRRRERQRASTRPRNRRKAARRGAPRASCQTHVELFLRGHFPTWPPRGRERQPTTSRR